MIIRRINSVSSPNVPAAPASAPATRASMACTRWRWDDACANSVSQISDASYAGGAQIPIEAYQTGELWTYVWTRDLSYALHLGLAVVRSAARG